MRYGERKYGSESGTKSGTMPKVRRPWWESCGSWPWRCMWSRPGTNRSIQSGCFPADLWSGLPSSAPPQSAPPSWERGGPIQVIRSWGLCPHDPRRFNAGRPSSNSRHPDDQSTEGNRRFLPGQTTEESPAKESATDVKNGFDLGPRTALGSVLTVALSSAEVSQV